MLVILETFAILFAYAESRRVDYRFYEHERSRFAGVEHAGLEGDVYLAIRSSVSPEFEFGFVIEFHRRLIKMKRDRLRKSLILFIVIRIIHPLHEHFPTRDLIRESVFQQVPNRVAVLGTPYHGIQILVFSYFAPIHALFQSLPEHEVEPDSRASSIPIHERVRDIHIDILIDDFVKGILWHLVDFFERTAEILGHRKLESVF
jgi:hypothetical protein